MDTKVKAAAMLMSEDIDYLISRGYLHFSPYALKIISKTVYGALNQQSLSGLMSKRREKGLGR
jgi:hypothetical protein